jgi:hypothetical protein
MPGGAGDRDRQRSDGGRLVDHDQQGSVLGCAMWLRWLELAMVNCRDGPKWASIGLAQDAYVGVKHSSTRFFFAQRRMVSPL